jgi:hypothetical protein
VAGLIQTVHCSISTEVATRLFRPAVNTGLPDLFAVEIGKAPMTVA